MEGRGTSSRPNPTNLDEPGLDGPPLSLTVGDVVVYAGHGIGRVVAVRDDVVVLDFAPGLTVTLPVARARESMRPISTEAELERVQHTLQTVGLPIEQSWAKRFRVTREKVAAGDATELAEVVRDGFRRQRESAKRGTTVSVSERELYLKARRLLADEIGLARGVDPLEADGWIGDQVALLPS